MLLSLELRGLCVLVLGVLVLLLAAVLDEAAAEVVACDVRRKVCVLPLARRVLCNVVNTRSCNHVIIVYALCK